MRTLLYKISIMAIMIFTMDWGVATLLKEGLAKYDQLDKQAEVVCIGNSHTVWGIDANKLEKCLNIQVARYARQGASLQERFVMIKNYYYEQSHRPELVVFDVDASTFDKWELSKNSYLRFYPYMDNPMIGNYIKEQGASREEYWARKLIKLLRYNDSWLVRSAIKGYMNRVDTSPSVKVDVSNLILTLKPHEEEFLPYPDNVSCFEAIIRLVRSYNAKLVLLFIPTIDVLNHAQKDKHDKVVKLLKKYSADNDGVIFIDYNNKYEHDHDLFADGTHLNNEGMKLITDSLGSDLRDILINSGKVKAIVNNN